MTKLRTAILTDSTCDIPRELLRKYRIHVIPQVIIWGEESYLDRVEISPSEFYHRLAEEDGLPSTTQPSPAAFKETYEEIFAQGADQILVFTVSSAMSGTYQLAARVASELEKPIRVVDSKAPTMSLGWQVLAAARAREEGLGMEAMVTEADRVRKSLTQIVYLNTLKYLHQGGRIGKAAMWLGSLLNFKPLVSINHQTGLVEGAGRARTHHGGVDMMWQLFLKSFQPHTPSHIAVLHGNAPREAEELADRIQREIQPRELIINITGPVLGINTGPGALALCGYARHEEGD